MTAASPGGDCPRWKKFIRQVTNDNEELQRYLQRIAAYALTGITREQELFFFYGTGNNGKGVWVFVISGILRQSPLSSPSTNLSLNAKYLVDSANCASVDRLPFSDALLLKRMANAR